MASGVDVLVQAGLLPLTSIFIEPAKILFLNNAINHGIFSPLGIQQSQELGQSVFFLIEANLVRAWVLLAYMLFGKGSAKQTSGGAAVIHFFGGIHRNLFSLLLLMNPRLLITVITVVQQAIYIGII